MSDENQQDKPNININVNLDNTPVLYTDMIHMSTNPSGVVLDVTQRLMTSNQVQIVSRIGMSREHAKEFVKQLGNLLAMTDGQLQTGEKKN